MKDWQSKFYYLAVFFFQVQYNYIDIYYVCPFLYVSFIIGVTYRKMATFTNLRRNVNQFKSETLKLHFFQLFFSFSVLINISFVFFGKSVSVHNAPCAPVQMLSEPMVCSKTSEVVSNDLVVPYFFQNFRLVFAFEFPLLKF